MCYMEKATKAWQCKGRQKHNKKGTAAVNQNDHRPAPLTEHAPDSTATSTHEPSRTTATNTANLHARQMHLASTTQNQQGRRQSPLRKRSPVRGAGGPSRSTTQTPPATAGTRGTPLPGGPATLFCRHNSSCEGLVVNHGRTASLRGGGAVLFLRWQVYRFQCCSRAAW